MVLCRRSTLGDVTARGPYSKTAAKRAEILDAALRLIAENGYGGATVQQIADAVGLTKAGVLHHFGSRDGLLLAVLDRRDEVDVRYESTDDFVEGFLAVVRHNTEVPGLVALYAAMSGEPASDAARRRFFEHRYAVIVGRFQASIEAKQAAGTISTVYDASTLARLLVAAADGLQTQWLLDPTLDMARHLETLVALIRR